MNSGDWIGILWNLAYALNDHDEALKHSIVWLKGTFEIWAADCRSWGCPQPDGGGLLGF